MKSMEGTIIHLQAPHSAKGWEKSAGGRQGRSKDKRKEGKGLGASSLEENEPGVTHQEEKVEHKEAGGVPL